MIQRDVSPNIPAGRLQLRGLRLALMTRDVNSATAADVLRREIVLYDSLPSLYTQTRRNAIVTSCTTASCDASVPRKCTPRGYERRAVYYSTDTRPIIASWTDEPVSTSFLNGWSQDLGLCEMDFGAARLYCVYSRKWTTMSRYRDVAQRESKRRSRYLSW